MLRIPPSAEFSHQTGKELWATHVGAGAHALPMTYLARDGKQYVAIMVSGGGFLGDPTIPATLMVFAIPGRATLPYSQKVRGWEVTRQRPSRLGCCAFLNDGALCLMVRQMRALLNLLSSPGDATQSSTAFREYGGTHGRRQSPASRNIDRPDR